MEMTKIGTWVPMGKRIGDASYFVAKFVGASLLFIKLYFFI